MNVRRLAAGLLLAVLAVPAALPARAQDYAPGALLVRWKPAARAAARAAALAPLGAARVAAYDFIGVEKLSVTGMSVPEAVARLALDPRVEYAEPDYLWSIDRTPNDPRYVEQYALHNSGQTGGLAGADISAEGAWEKFTGDSTLLIGDIDTGAEYDHPDLAANIWTNPGEIPGNGIDDDHNGYVDDVHGYDFVNHDGDPRDDNGHGTHTAGTIAAVGDNGVGVSGVLWHAKIVVLKFLSGSGSGPTSAAVEAIQYSVKMGIRVTNNSWGGGLYSRALEDAIAAAGAAGQLFIAAAGNARTNTDVVPNYPGALPEDCIVSVAATDAGDQLAGFSNFGVTTVDLAAPGVDILSTWPGRTYRLLSGTSMATPHVTAAAAFLMGRFPAMAAPEVKARLLRLATPLPGLAGRCVSGGRLNLDLAASDPDSLAPGPIADLEVTLPGSNTVDLAWTATGDDSTAGTATTYELRTSTEPLTADNFAAATPRPAPHPGAVGHRESWRVQGLVAGTPYWFAVRALDEFGNAGPISNAVATTTLPPPAITITPNRFQARATTGDTVRTTVEIANDSPGTLAWTASRPVVDASASAAWPAENGQKGEDGPARGPQTESSGGPDTFGYRWTDSSEPGGPTFDWADIATPANALDLAGDESISPAVPIGFGFPYYGHHFTQLRVCTNGYLQFGNDDPLFVNAGLPSPGGARNMVAPFWDDLNFGTSVRRAYVRYDGARCVISWIAVPRYNDLGSVMTFQALLYPTGEIRFQYLHMTGNDGNASIGIQDSTRHVGLLVAFDQAYVRDSLAVRIAPVREWLAIDPTEGFLLPGARQSVRLQLDASGLGSGTFHGAVRIASNAPAPADTGIAASMEVLGAPDIALSPPRLDFGPNFLGAHDTLAVTISNAGVDPLHVSGVSTDAAVFAVGGAAFTLPPGDARTLPVVFAPAAIARYAGSLTVASDDPDHPLASVSLQGAGSESPAIAVGVTQLRSAEAPALRPDAIRSVRPLVVRNSGGAALTWTASAFQGAIARPQDGSGARPALVEPASALPAIAQIKNTIGPGFGTLGTGGPDAFGYRSIDSDAPGGPAFGWQEIEAVGTRLFASADDSTARIALPFAFSFYGTAHDSVSVCTNGWLSFTSRDSSLVNTDLPNAAPGVPRALIAPYWTDLDLRTARGPGRVYAWYDGSKLIVEWKDAVHFSGASPYTFEVFLWPSGEIEYQYLALGPLNTIATIGIQDDTGTIGLSVAYNVFYAHAGLRVRIRHLDDWLQVRPVAGSIPPGAADTLQVTFDAKDYKPGEYAGEVRVASNDAAQPLLAVPCAMHVGVAAFAAEAEPGSIAAISLAPLVHFVLSPGSTGTLRSGSLEANGIPVRAVGDAVHGSDGRLDVAVRALDLLAALPAGDSVALALTGELDAGGWFSAATSLAVTPPAIIANPLPPFGSPLPERVFRGNEGISLSWIPPAGGADDYAVAYTSDGGVRWTVLTHTDVPRAAFIPADTTSRALLEVVARRGDTVAGTWLSAPFVVDLEVVPIPGGPPARFALRMAGESPTRGPVRMGLDQPATRDATIEVFDVRGGRVRTLWRGRLAAGHHPFVWDCRSDAGTAVAPGLYLMRARSDDEERKLRIVVLR